MKITIDENSCIVQREKGDRAYYGRPDTPYGGGESNLLHNVKVNLIEQGYDLIKKRMCKDGHLVDSLQQYLRARNPKKLKPGEIFCIYDTSWAVRNSAEDYNHHEPVTFRIERAQG